MDSLPDIDTGRNHFADAGRYELFDAVCQSFATTATGGYSTKQASISYWNSPFIEYVVAIFMLLSGVNFALFLMCLRGKVSRLLRDEELRWFLGSVAILTFLITFALVFQNHYDWELAFRKALFQVSTVHTSCGFATDDYNMWPPFTVVTVVYCDAFGRVYGFYQWRYQEYAVADCGACHPE